MKKKILLITAFILTFFSIVTFAQTISGKITDAEGSPLVGASVLVKGTSNGTVTDANGAFSLSNITKGSTLVISFVGYTNKEVSADGNLNITLEEGDALGELVVTAENRSVSAQTVPITLELVTGRAIEKQGATDLLQLQNLAPGLNMVTNTVFNQINIRGVGSNDGAAELSDQAVTLGIDGEYINRPVALNAALFDLDRIEVLKGPQGTLYGRNSTAGAINIIAKKPTDRVEVDLKASYGNYNTTKLNGAVNVPLGKIAAIRVAGMLSKHDGYRDGNVNGNTTSPGRIDNGNVWATRAGLSINPTKALSIYIAGDVNKTDQTASSQYGIDVLKADSTLKNQVPRNFTPKTEYPKDYPVATAGFLKIDQAAIRTRIAYDFGAAKITYSGGFRDVELKSYQPLNGFVPETFSFDNTMAYKTQSHELRVNGESTRFIWQAGVFYGNEDQTSGRGLVLPSAKGAFGGKVPYLNFTILSVNSKTTAGFAQATYKLTEKLGLTGGLRYTSDEKLRNGALLTRAPFGPPGTPAYFYPVPPQATQNGMSPITGKGDWQKATWMVNMDYQVDNSKMLFAKISTGYKAGGFDNYGAYDPEELTSLEIGSKNRFMDNRLRLNASLFNYNYQKQQVSTFINTTIGNAIQNAGSTKVFGLEIDGDFAATKNDRLKWAVNFLNAEFVEFSTTVNRVNTTAEVTNLKGNKPVQAPRWTLTGGYDHDFAVGSGTLNVGIQTMFKSAYHLTPFNFATDKQAAFTKTDAFLTYTAKGSKWDIGAFVHNIEDNRIFTYANFNGSNINLFNWTFGAPRLLGLQANYHFRGTRK